MNYYASLAFHLRIRKLPEKQVGEIVQGACYLSRGSDQSPEEQFGPASTYAEQFPMGTTTSQPTRIAVIVLCMVFGVMASDLIMSLFWDERLMVGGVRVLYLCVAAEVVVIVAALAADHRVPKSASA
ncbi:MAG: hypothetical protein ACRCYX_05175 [Dermatophilaceae bacterium]